MKKFKSTESAQLWIKREGGKTDENWNKEIKKERLKKREREGEKKREREREREKGERERVISKANSSLVTFYNCFPSLILFSTLSLFNCLCLSLSYSLPLTLYLYLILLFPLSLSLIPNSSQSLSPSLSFPPLLKQTWPCSDTHTHTHTHTNTHTHTRALESQKGNSIGE